MYLIFLLMRELPRISLNEALFFSYSVGHAYTAGFCFGFFLVIEYTLNLFMEGNVSFRSRACHCVSFPRFVLLLSPQKCFSFWYFDKNSPKQMGDCGGGTKHKH